VGRGGAGQHLLTVSLPTFTQTLQDHGWLLVHFHRPLRKDTDSPSPSSSSSSAAAAAAAAAVAGSVASYEVHGQGHARTLQVLSECADRLKQEGHPARIAAYELSGTQDEARLLAEMEVFFGGATSTYAFHRNGHSVLPYLGPLDIDAVLAFMRAGPAAAAAAIAAASPSGIAAAPAGPTLAAGGAAPTKDRRQDAIRAAASNLVRELSPATANVATSSHIKLQVLVCADFSSPDSEDATVALTALAEAAVELQGRFLFLYLDAKRKDNDKILARVDGHVDDCPLVRVADTRNKGFAVWQPQAKSDGRRGGRFDFSTSAGLVALARAFEARQLKRVVQSEPRPAKMSQPVGRIVGSMFNETVMDYAGDVLLYLYMDGCPHCDKFSRIYSEAAMELHSTDTDVRWRQLFRG
jgi:hypothetical protein